MTSVRTSGTRSGMTAAAATSLFIALLVGSILVKATDVSFMSKMMEDMGRRTLDKSACYTPYDLEAKFSRACIKVVDDKVVCDFAWDAFTGGFKFKDPNSVTEEDYNQYFTDVLSVMSAPNSSVFWSGVPSVVEEISKHHNISSSFNEMSSKIFNIMTEEFNVTCWCGNKTAILDTVNPCPMKPTAAFWEAFSSHFGEAGKGIVFWVGDGNKEGGAYQNTSFFTTVEFPKLTFPRVIRLIAVDIYECGHKMVEKCGEGTMKLLEEQAVKKYGSMGYKCANVCGNPLDEHEVPFLADKTLQIIREVQHIVGN